jgi:hypothetical protein
MLFLPITKKRKQFNENPARLNKVNVEIDYRFMKTSVKTDKSRQEFKTTLLKITIFHGQHIRSYARII